MKPRLIEIVTLWTLLAVTAPVTAGAGVPGREFSDYRCRLTLPRTPLPWPDRGPVPHAQAVVGADIGTLLCVAASAVPQDIVRIYVIDDFSGENSHGSLVADMARRYSLKACDVVPCSVSPGRLGLESIDPKGYLDALLDISRQMDENPRLRVVINMSFGGSAYSLLEHAVIKHLHDKGAIMIAAAGNDNSPFPLYPAAFDEVMAVAEVSGKVKSDASNYGSHVDISASGFYRREVAPQVSARYGYSGTEVTYYRIRGGTSFAAPRVAGTIAYLLQQRPELSGADAMALVQKHATALSDVYYRDGQLGAGELNVRKTFYHGIPSYRKAIVWRNGVTLAAVLLTLFHSIALHARRSGYGVDLLALNGTLIVVVWFLASWVLEAMAGLIWGNVIVGVLAGVLPLVICARNVSRTRREIAAAEREDQRRAEEARAAAAARAAAWVPQPQGMHEPPVVPPDKVLLVAALRAAGYDDVEIKKTLDRLTRPSMPPAPSGSRTNPFLF